MSSPFSGSLPDPDSARLLRKDKAWSASGVVMAAVGSLGADTAPAGVTGAVWVKPSCTTASSVPPAHAYEGSNCVSKEAVLPATDVGATPTATGNDVPPGHT